MIQLIRIIVFLISLGILLVTFIYNNKSLGRRTFFLLLMELAGLVMLNCSVSWIIKSGALAGILLFLIAIPMITVSIIYLIKNVKNKKL